MENKKYTLRKVSYSVPEVFDGTNNPALQKCIRLAIQQATGVCYSEITGRCRKRNVFYARLIYSKLCRLNGVALTGIAKETGHHHATVIYHLKKFDEDYQYNKEFAMLFDAVVGLMSDNLKSKSY